MEKFQGRPFSAALILATLLAGMATAEAPAPADLAQEEAFLDVLPKVVVPDAVQPIPGAVNEEFRNCKARWPPEYALSQKGPEARAYRDIYGLIKVRNVIETQDCTCAGKVAAWTEVEVIAKILREKNHITELRAQHTEALHAEGETLFPIAETMCGGKF